jgi:hypothetical protein
VFTHSVSIVIGVFATIAIALPVFRPFPKLPTYEMRDTPSFGPQRFDNIRPETNEKFNLEVYDAWRWQVKCTTLGLALLVFSLVV